MANIMGYAVPPLVRVENGTASGSTVDLTNGQFNHLFLTKGTTTAAYTINLPTSPVDGQLVFIANTAAVTAVTFSPTVAGAPSGLTAGQGIVVAYSSTLPGWYTFQI